MASRSPCPMDRTSKPWPARRRRHTGIAALDIDNDRDLDLVLGGRGRRTDRGPQRSPRPVPRGADRRALGECRLGIAGHRHRRRRARRPGRDRSRRTGARLAERDGRSVARTARIRFESWPINAKRWRSGAGHRPRPRWAARPARAPAPSEKPGEPVVPAWARNEGSASRRSRCRWVRRARVVDGLTAVRPSRRRAPDLLAIRPGEPPALARNLGNGHHWLALELDGHWQVRSPGCGPTRTGSARDCSSKGRASTSGMTTPRPTPAWPNRSRRSSWDWANATEGGPHPFASGRTASCSAS